MLSTSDSTDTSIIWVTWSSLFSWVTIRRSIPPLMSTTSSIILQSLVRHKGIIGRGKAQVASASSVRSLVLRVIHMFLSGTVTWRSDSTRVINWHKFHCLLSMADNIPYHMGFVLATVFHHQATDPRASTIFIGPYITILLQGIDLLGNLDWLTIMGGYNPITFHSLEKLGLPMPSSSMQEHTPPPTYIEHSQWDNLLFL